MEFEQLIQLLQTVSDSELTSFQYEKDGLKLKLQKEKAEAAPGKITVAAPVMQAAEVPVIQAAALAPAAQAGTAETASVEEKPGKVITSPLVGTFYAAPAEDADPFVAEGVSVKKGQTVAIVEAMKLMNEIESEFDGTVAEILVENGESVEFGQPLFRIV